MQINFISSSFIQTLTVGPGVAPSQPLFDIAAGRGLYRSRESHPALKISVFCFYRNILFIFTQFVNTFFRQYMIWLVCYAHLNFSCALIFQHTQIADPHISLQDKTDLRYAVRLRSVCEGNFNILINRLAVPVALFTSSSA